MDAINGIQAEKKIAWLSLDEGDNDPVRFLTYLVTALRQAEEGNISNWGEEMTVTVEIDRDRLPVTTLTGTFDQAGLHGLLHKLYSLGLPLISVICLEFK